jgi:hypothetical protein
MRERLHVTLAVVLLFLSTLACKKGESTSTATASASASAIPPAKPWIEQAHAVWTQAQIEIANHSDAGINTARVAMTYTKGSVPKPEDVARSLQALLAIDGTAAPCSLDVMLTDDRDAGPDSVFLIGHYKIESGTAYKALAPREIAKRFVERITPKGTNDLACDTATWAIVNSPGGFLRSWRAYARDYSNVWDGSHKDALEGEKICEQAVDLDILRGETFPDSSEAIDNGVRFPQTSSQTIKWRSYANYETTKSWFTCTVNANEAPTIAWDRKRE